MESKPENVLHDLRIPCPFTELQGLSDAVDVDVEVRYHIADQIRSICARVSRVLTTRAARHSRYAPCHAA